ncbi:LuxR C-terminal-related transcriptional regulator [Paenarthrobacter nitroguajacolicus]|uniref:LuxR C-terminal-related transcriptional regulator n=1 Tax=Paenarthrobacter nitroguajacolicus TaxID=211146 RepID=UPI003AE15ED0
MVTRLLVVDHHQLMIDTLDAWFRCNTPDLVVSAGLNVVPGHHRVPLGPELSGTAPLGPELSGTASSWPEQEITVAILGTLDPSTELIPAVHLLVESGLRVVVLATRLDGWEAGAVRVAGALGYVPKSAGPRHIELAIRAAAAGREYLHPDAAAVVVDTAPVRVKLSLREQRLAELYLGSEAMSVRGVADAMGISEQTVKAHLHRIRQRYGAAGIKLGNVISLRQQLSADGWIT